MFPITSGVTQGYLSILNANQQQMQQTEAQLSSGYRIQQASDAPADVEEILQIQNSIGQDQQAQSNLSTLQTDLGSADSALQTAVQAVESAISVGTQGANSTATPEEQSALAQQVAGILQTLVDIGNTQVNGRYIFSGDNATQAAYEVNVSAPEGVQNLVNTNSTVQVVDSSGSSIPAGEGAQQIFDEQAVGGGPAAGNVFVAVNSLLTALQTNNSAGVTNALGLLNSADAYLNQQLAFYGATENRVTAATNLAQSTQTQEQGDLSQLRDADIPTLAAQLTSEQTQQQAALSVESGILQMKNIFSYLA
jgi:flagellar hook-associated protein 3 FlgL